MNRIVVTSTGVFIWALVVGIGAVILSQCHHLTPREQTIFEAPYTVDTSEIVIDTCTPIPQCVDPEPGPQQRPQGDTNGIN